MNGNVTKKHDEFCNRYIASVSGKDVHVLQINMILAKLWSFDGSQQQYACKGIEICINAFIDNIKTDSVQSWTLYITLYPLHWTLLADYNKLG